MKTKLFSCAILSAALTLLVGCNHMEDVNVNDVAGELSASSFEGTVTRSKTVVDGLSIRILEWTIVDAEKDQIAPNVVIFGDGVFEEYESVNYTYKQQGLRADGLGINYLFTPASGEAINVVYWGNSLVIKNDTIGDASAPIANLMKVAEDLPNHKWAFEQSALEIHYDTITKMDTVITSVKRPDPVTGKPKIEKDTTIVEKTVINADTLGLKSYVLTTYEINRDAKTLANTIAYKQITRDYELNAAGTATVQKGKDQVVEETYHWGIGSLTSAKRFKLATLDSKNQAGLLSISGFDIKKGLITIGNDEYKLAD